MFGVVEVNPDHLQLMNSFQAVLYGHKGPCQLVSAAGDPSTCNIVFMTFFLMVFKGKRNHSDSTCRM